ncbi:MFS general substrate transporter [Karstenula rhodostoma CBS 690.94]|uniref:MFS general substrate transporter n=1 Tax=Karstenula rhodostoma CBS 690.94 TaxID=1392251 RepID=A0A9P4PFU7_9PLEO|nr:MFS general substrate transporter [Karstenula rhodostoma CBS 690.94]
MDPDTVSLHIADKDVFDEPENLKSVKLQADWTNEEEKRAKRKLDYNLMPLLVLRFFYLQLDRGNIANAITDTFMGDVGITQFQFNIGQQLLSSGIILFKIPSNMLLHKVGPGKWLTIQLFFFSIVGTFQAWQKNYSSYLATRFLLGMAESGYIPGGLWTLSTWYTRKETAKRVMVFFFDNQLGQACAKLIAYGTLRRHPQPPHLAAFKRTFSNPIIWIHFFITMANNGRGFDTYGPTIIKSFGFSWLSSNALASVGLFLQIPVNYAFSYMSDRHACGVFGEERVRIEVSAPRDVIRRNALDFGLWVIRVAPTDAAVVRVSQEVTGMACVRGVPDSKNEEGF